MSDLKSAVKDKLFGGKLKFRSDMDGEIKDTGSATPAETVEEKEQE